MKKVQRWKVKRMVFHSEGESKELDDIESLDEHVMSRRAVPFLPYHPGAEKIDFSSLSTYAHRDLRTHFPMGGDIDRKQVFKKLIYMKPDDFIEAAGWGVPATTSVGQGWKKWSELKRKIRSEKVLVDTPYLIVNEHGNVIDHSGRHRALAAKEIGMERVPVVLIFDDWNGYNQFVSHYGVKQQRARKRTMLDRAVRMVRR